MLVGNPGDADTMLAAPIILYDYPQIAPESPGDLYDGTEIDEILSLRIMTLSEEEKELARSVDDRARALLERTDALDPERLAALHGAARDAAPRRRMTAMPLFGEWDIPEDPRCRWRAFAPPVWISSRATACDCVPSARPTSWTWSWPAASPRSRPSNRILKTAFTWPSPWTTIRARTGAGSTSRGIDSFFNPTTRTFGLVTCVRAS